MDQERKGSEEEEEVNEIKECKLRNFLNCGDVHEILGCKKRRKETDA